MARRAGDVLVAGEDRIPEQEPAELGRAVRGTRHTRNGSLGRHASRQYCGHGHGDEQ